MSVTFLLKFLRILIKHQFNASFFLAVTDYRGHAVLSLYRHRTAATYSDTQTMKCHNGLSMDPYPHVFPLKESK